MNGIKQVIFFFGGYFMGPIDYLARFFVGKVRDIVDPKEQRILRYKDYIINQSLTYHCKGVAFRYGIRKEIISVLSVALGLLMLSIT